MKKFIAAHVVLALVPISTGILDMVTGTTLLAPGLDPALDGSRALDSNLRFFGGFWLVAGLVLLWALLDLRARAGVVRLLWAGIFVGGLGRIVGALSMGLPPAPFIGFGVLELVGAPLAVLWLSAVLSAADTPDTPERPLRDRQDGRQRTARSLA
ncbi:MAG: DUF4345 domain-containing protein [Myxococcaceae bacterium]|nr:DUF4345 domain-containing protein [Myxococcaceae bacterium]